MSDDQVPPDGTEAEDQLERDILDGLREIFERLDPMPPELDELVLFALASRDLDAELARIVEDELVRPGTRASGRVRSIRFELQGLEMLVTVVEGATGRRRVDGWLAPPQPATVEARTPQAPQARPPSADQSGRFALPDLGSGPTQFVVRLEGRTLVTPVVQL